MHKNTISPNISHKVLGSNSCNLDFISSSDNSSFLTFFQENTHYSKYKGLLFCLLFVLLSLKTLLCSLMHASQIPTFLSKPVTALMYITKKNIKQKEERKSIYRLTCDNERVVFIQDIRH